jgi:DNA-binding transcriptional MerR regulator
MFKIGEFSKLSNISVRSLRHYESLGLLAPAEIDRFTGYRQYCADQLETANKIRMLREVGFSLDSIKGLLNSDSIEHARQYYELRQTEVEEELESLRQKKDMLRLLLEDMDESMDCYNVVEKTIPQKTVLHIQRTLPSYDNVKNLWQELFADVGRLGFTPKEPLFLRSLCLDKEYKESDVEVELHIEVDGMSARQETDRIIITPAAHAATVTFSGGYRKGNAVRRALARRLEANRQSSLGTMFNTPHLSSLIDPDPDHWINEWGFELVSANKMLLNVRGAL